mgnify:CR=1 FL=1
MQYTDERFRDLMFASLVIMGVYSVFGELPQRLGYIYHRYVTYRLVNESSVDIFKTIFGAKPRYFIKAIKIEMFYSTLQLVLARRQKITYYFFEV